MITVHYPASSSTAEKAQNEKKKKKPASRPLAHFCFAPLSTLSAGGNTGFTSSQWRKGVLKKSK